MAGEVDPETEASMERRGGLWRHRDFRRLWAGQTVSMFGSIVSGTAIPFTAVLALKAGPGHMAMLGAANLLPGILASLFAGVWVDRLKRRPILIATDLGRALLLVTIPVAAFLGALHIALLYVVAFLTAALSILFDVAYQSYLPSLVSPEELAEGNSKLAASAAVAEVGGFSLAGWLVQAFTGPVAVLIDAASFLVSAACVGRIRAPEPPAILAEDRAGVRAEIVEGLRLVLGHPILRPLGTVAVLSGLTGGVFGTLILLYTAREMGFSPGVLGMIFAVGGATAFLGAVGAESVTRRFGLGRTLVWCLVIETAGILLIPIAHGATLLSGALLVAQQVIADPAGTIYEIQEVTLRQSVTPDRLLGRMNAGLRFARLSAVLLGTLAAGWLGARLGIRPTLAIAALGTLASAACLAASPVMGMTSPPVKTGG